MSLKAIDFKATNLYNEVNNLKGGAFVKYYVGIDIGGTKINIGILNGENQLVASKVTPVPAKKDCESVLSLAAATLDLLCEEMGIQKRELISVGIGVPGTVSADFTVAKFVPNLGWYDAPVAEIFKALTGISAKVLQDSRAGAYGEYMAGNGKNSKALICITLGTGIGTGLVIDGKIYHGALLSAGELGHIPVAEQGRPCGCGKNGCLECYAAGKGLDMTAKEFYGEDATARDLFDAAKNGDEDAHFAINQAINMLGKVIVSAINLISPDCLIFSGGLSAQMELYLNPLVEYIKEHSYKTEGQQELKIALAKWREDAPMIGAALFGKENVINREAVLSASLMCANQLNLGEELIALADAGIKLFHIDMMDGSFVPNYMISTETVKAISGGSEIPLDIHLMVENPDLAIEMLPLRPDDIVTVHFETSRHIHRTLSLIKAKGARAGLAINPGTPLSAVEELLDDIDMLLIMTVNPGFAGQKLVSGALDKIKRARNLLDSTGHSNILLEVDGNCSFENIPKMYEAGADVFVVGTSSVFHKDYTYKTAAQSVFESLE